MNAAMRLLKADKNHITNILLAYLAGFLIIWFCGVNFKSGPCTPNLDIFSWLIAVGISLLLLIKNLFLALSTKRQTKFYSLSIHAIAFVALVIWGSL
jgi:hypothetical protein